MFQEFSKTSMIHSTRLILKPWTMFTERVHSRPGTSQVSPGPQPVILIFDLWQNVTQNTLIITNRQEPASGRRTRPGQSPAPLWQRRWAWAWFKTFDGHCDARRVAGRWRPPPVSTPCVMAASGSGVPSPSDNRRGERQHVKSGLEIMFPGRQSRNSSASWTSQEPLRILNQMQDSEKSLERKVF